jgi:TP901 family phage tail tape measure protein
VGNKTGTGQLVVDIRIKTGNSASQVKKANTALRGLRKTVVQLRRGAAEFRYGVSNILGGVRPAMFAGTIAAFGALRETMRFDQEIANLSGVLGGLGKEAPKISRAIKEMALDPRNAANAQEAARAYTDLARSGVRGQKGLRVAGVALRLAAVDTNMSVQQASKFLPKMQKMFGVSFEDMGDVLSRGADQIPGNVSDIVTAMQFAGPATKQFGLDIHESMGLVMMTINRLKPSITGTTVRRFLSVFGDEKKAAALEKIIGKDSIFTQSGKLKPIGGIFTKIGQAFKNLTDEENLTNLKNIFGLRAQALVGALSDELTGLGESWDQWAKKTRTGAGLTAKASEVMKGLGARLKQIRTALGVIAIDFVGQLFDVRKAGGFADQITKVALAFGRLADLKKGESSSVLLGQKDEAGKALFDPEHIRWAQGLRDAVDGVKDAFTSIGNIFSSIFGTESTGTRGMAKMITMFVALSPVAMAFGVVLNSVLGIARGIFLIFSGMGRILWTGLIKPMIFASKVMWRFLSGEKLVNMETGRLGRTFTELKTKLGAFHDQQAATYRRNKQLHNSFQAGTMTLTNYVKKGLGGLLKGILSIAGPTAIATAAIWGLTELIGGLADAGSETDRRLQDLRAGKGDGGVVSVVDADVNRMINLLTAGGREMRTGSGKTVRVGAASQFRAAQQRGVSLDLRRILGEIGFTAAGRGPKYGEEAAAYRRAGKRISGLGFRLEQAEEMRGAMETFKKFAEAGARIREFGSTTEEALQSLGMGSEEIEAVIATYEAQGVSSKKLGERFKQLERIWVSGIAASQHQGVVTDVVTSRLEEFGKTVQLVEQQMMELVFAQLSAQMMLGAAAGVATGADAAKAGAVAGAKKRCIESHVSLGIGGRKVAEAVAKANLDLNQRGGATATAWQKHRILHQGAVTVTT